MLLWGSMCCLMDHLALFLCVMVNLFGKLRKNKVAAKSRSAMRSGLAVWLPFFDMVKKGDLVEGLVVKRKDGKYSVISSTVSGEICRRTLVSPPVAKNSSCLTRGTTYHNGHAKG
jgi:hypothetical protein